MTENEKIKRLIDKYDEYFIHSNADVGHTKKGRWFFCEYDEDHDDYNSFFLFSTADELKQIMTKIMADDLNILIETGTEEICHALQEIDIGDALENQYENSLLRLSNNLEVLIQECRRNSEKAGVIFQALAGITSEHKRND